MNLFIYEHLTALGARVGSEEPALASSLLTEGRAMLEAILADFQQLPEVTTRILPPRLSAREQGQLFRQYAHEADYSLIIAPETHGVLEQLANIVLDEGGKLLGPSPKFIALTSDKRLLEKHLRQSGIPTPQTWLLGSEPTTLYPKIWKPIDGAGSQATFLIRSPEEEPTAMQQCLNEDWTLAKMLAQEYLEGLAVSQSVIMGPAQNLYLPTSTQLLTQDGRFQYLGGEVPLEDTLANRAKRLVEATLDILPPSDGYIGFDLILGSNGDFVIEINPRLTTSYIGLRRVVKNNLAKMMLSLAKGTEPEPLELQKGKWRFHPTGECNA